MDCGYGYFVASFALFLSTKVAEAVPVFNSAVDVSAKVTENSPIGTTVISSISATGTGQITYSLTSQRDDARHPSEKFRLSSTLDAIILVAEKFPRSDSSHYELIIKGTDLADNMTATQTLVITVLSGTGAGLVANIVLVIVGPVLMLFLQ